MTSSTMREPTITTSLLLSLALLALPATLLAQSEAAGALRPLVSVFVAFAVSWVMVAAWVARIGAKVERIIQAEHDDGGHDSTDGAA